MRGIYNTYYYRENKWVFITVRVLQFDRRKEKYNITQYVFGPYKLHKIPLQ